jgi:hypothetical protein
MAFERCAVAAIDLMKRQAMIMEALRQLYLARTPQETLARL